MRRWTFKQHFEKFVDTVIGDATQSRTLLESESLSLNRRKNFARQAETLSISSAERIAMQNREAPDRNDRLAARMDEFSKLAKEAENREIAWLEETGSCKSR